MHTVAAGLTVVLGALTCLCAAAGEQEKSEEKEMRLVGHQVLTVPIEFFCRQKGLPVKTDGEGPCRVMAIGRGTFPQARAVLQSAEKTLEVLDLWTGQQHAFVSENPTIWPSSSPTRITCSSLIF